MLSEITATKIQMLYKKYQNDISLFTKEDLNSLMNYFLEHPLFNDTRKTKGYTIFKKIILNLKIKPCEKNDTIVKFNSNRNIFNILLYGDIKKRNAFKGMSKQKLQKNSGKYLYCIYHCLSDALFFEINRHHYMKYIVADAVDLYDKFVEKISKYSFFENLPYYQYNKLFLNYEEKKYNHDEIIYNEGDNIDGIYLILKGKCLIYKKRVSNYFDINGKNYLPSWINELSKNENKNKYFKPVFARNNKRNDLLTMTEGDIFGDLEINLNGNNKREFSVKCADFKKTKVCFFPLNIIKSIVNKFQNISEQKNEIIRTRFKYCNIVDKVKKENNIHKNEIKLPEMINNNKNSNSNFKCFHHTINICNLMPDFNNIQTQKNYKERNLFNNMFLMSDNNSILKRKSKSINKYNLTPRKRIQILNNKSQNIHNLISIIKENKYAKKIKLDMLVVKSINNQKNNKNNFMNEFDKEFFQRKINKNDNKYLIKSSNDITY